MRLFRSALAGLLCALVILPAAALAQGLQLTTQYPAVTVDPGATARFPLSVTTDAPERVDLLVVEAPEGWEVRLRGGGSTIEAVYTGGEQPPEATLEVSVPEDAAAGDYRVVLEGRSAGGTQQLTLDLRVEQAAAGSVTLTAQFPSLRGPSDATFQFDLELENGTNQETTFSLEAQAPRGWRAEARPTSQEQAATAVVEAGASERIRVTVTPPPSVPAGQYPILVRAVGGPQPTEVPLAVEITGTPSVALETADQRLNARVTVGSSSTLNLLVINDGSAPLTDLRLSATPPQEWQVTFSPETITELGPREQQNVQAQITPAGNAIAGDYAITVRLSSEEVSDQIELRTTVETSPVGGIIGLALLGVIVVGLLLVFRRYGRR